MPIQNYLGWLVTTFAVYALYRGYERVRPAPGSAPRGVLVRSLPLVAYGAMMVANMVAGGPPELAVIAPFVMGVPLLAAAGRLRPGLAER